jgi:choline dehydrogenase-like flavoprotein
VDRGKSYDYVIVGGGSAGCTMAARLGEIAEARILLIEAGPPDVSPHPLSRAFVRAAQQAGLRHDDDFNGTEQEGAGLYQVTQRDGRHDQRQSTRETRILMGRAVASASRMPGLLPFP